MNTLVVDLSHHNPTPDWQALKSSGIVGVIHKATEGEGYTDPTLFQRAAEATAAGLCWATYHFLRPGYMTPQMAYYLAEVDPVEGERICLDHEDAGVSLDDLCTCVEYLTDVRPDLQIAIYSGHLIKEQLGGTCNALLAEHTSLWIAQYTSAAVPSWPKGTWPMWSLWQYTDRYSNPAISAPVDGNRWNGSVDNLRKWFGPAGETAGLAPEDLSVVTHARHRQLSG